NDLTTKYINDQFGEVKEEIDPQGDDTRYTYNAFGEQVSVSDPMGESTTYNYDVNTGNLLSTTDPLRRTTSFQYFSTGDLKSITSGAGPGSTRSDLVTTSFNYNADGDLLNTTDNSGVTWTLSPDANGNQTGTSFNWVNPANSGDQHTVTTAAIPNANDQTAQATSSQGTATTTYDSLSRPVQMQDIYNRQTQTTYDARGLVIETRRQSPNASGGLQWMIQRTVYNAKGQPAVQTDTYAE